MTTKFGAFISMNSNKINHAQVKEQIDKFLSECYFDVQGFSTGIESHLTESYLAKVLTKLAIGSATVWWSMLEIKDFFALYKRNRSR